MTLRELILVTCAVSTVAIYIYMKISGEMWYGIQWGNLFRFIRRQICRILLKISNM